MINIFIGYDQRETVAYHTLCQSILKYSSEPLAFTPLNLSNFKNFYKRKKGEKDSTEFSISRFLTPYLSNFQGYSIYMDCDMLVMNDISKLLKKILVNKNKVVWCVQHKHIVKNKNKFLNEKQINYNKKNWSSFMIFNNKKCKRLTPKFIEKANGLYLHQFKWTSENQIGKLPLSWNTLSGYNNINSKTNNIHFTEGGPYFKKYKKSPGAKKWFEIKKEVISNK